MAVNNLADLEDIRQYVTFLLESEQEGGATFWPPEIIDSFVSAEHRNLVSLIHMQHEHYFSKPVITDIAANQEYYKLPADFRHIRLAEHRTPDGANKWRNIDPLERLEDRQSYWNAEGAAIGGGSASGSGAYLPREPHYIIQRNRLYIVPFFNQSLAGGLRIWYDYSPSNPDTNEWVPFDGLLPDHHEVIAIGVAIRCKKREEVPDQWSDLYQVLYNRLIQETENRQMQKRRHGAQNSGLY